jgi:hypothetical protein
MSALVWRIVVLLAWAAALIAFAAAALSTHESAAAFGGQSERSVVIAKSVGTATRWASEIFVVKG